MSSGPAWHPDELELECVRIGEGADRAQQHVRTCAQCQCHLDTLIGLASDLSAPLPEVEVPAAQDAALLSMARSAVAAKPAARIRAWMWAIPAVAAAAVLAFAILRPGPDRSDDATAVVPAGASDVNSDGTVDILDAFALAKTIRAGGATQPEWDVTGDQIVDQRDVDHIAQSAVSLGVSEDGE